MSPTSPSERRSLAQLLQLTLAILLFSLLAGLSGQRANQYAESARWWSLQAAEARCAQSSAGTAGGAAVSSLLQRAARVHSRTQDGAALGTRALLHPAALARRR
jgi:hypothetical protein